MIQNEDSYESISNDKAYTMFKELVGSDAMASDSAVPYNVERNTRVSEAIAIAEVDSTWAFLFPEEDEDGPIVEFHCADANSSHTYIKQVPLLLWNGDFMVHLYNYKGC